MQDGIVRQPRNWFTETATKIVENVKVAVDCVCKEWKPIRTALFQVLSSFPDCQQAVFQKLDELKKAQLRV